MKMLVRFALAFAVALLPFTGALAQQPGGSAQQQVASTPPLLSPSQRAALARELIDRWKGVVAKSPGGSVPAWSSKLAKVVATADAANVLAATAAVSLDAMHDALVGGQPAAPIVSREAIGNGSVAPQALGSTTGDLVYTPLPNGRCQIANSTVIASPLPASTVRSIDVEDISSYASQGGNGTFASGDGSTNCGIPSFTSALALMVSVTNPAQSGNLRVFANGQNYQMGNRLQYTGGSYGENSDMIVRSCETCSNEIAIYSTAQVDYSITVIGYFMPPEATALSCIETAETSVSVQPGGTANAVAPECAVGYTEVDLECQNTSWEMPFVYIANGTCSARNNGAGTATIRASRKCCRVPGR